MKCRQFGDRMGTFMRCRQHTSISSSQLSRSISGPHKYIHENYWLQVLYPSLYRYEQTKSPQCNRNSLKYNIISRYIHGCTIKHINRRFACDTLPMVIKWIRIYVFSVLHLTTPTNDSGIYLSRSQVERLLIQPLHKIRLSTAWSVSLIVMEISCQCLVELGNLT